MGRNRRGTGAWGKPDTVLQGAYPLRSAPNNRGRMANLMKKQVSLLLAALLLLGVMGGCTQSAPPPTATPTPAQESPSAPPATEIALSKAYIIVQGYEWGPAIPKIVLEFAEDVSGFASDTFEVAFGSTKRTVKDVYSSDEDGNKAEGAGKHLTIEMAVKSSEASPFAYNMEKNVNTWAEQVDFTVTVASGKSFSVGGTAYQGGDLCSYSATAADRKVPQTASWVKDTVEYHEEGKDITLTRAAWAPEGADSDSGKNPLIIWLHGMGEGGTDIDIDLLGNEVTALTTENETNVQKYFATDGLAGAYVLAVQTPTMWMDIDGNSTFNNENLTLPAKQESWYTGALWHAITSYVEGNPDVDTSRIYVGGCSNGGYMTMNMMFEHGGYFAAFYPICEAYLNDCVSDEMIQQVKDYNIWFVQSADDGTVNPSEYGLPTYVRLLEAGAQNVWFTLSDHVRGTDDPEPWSWTGTGTYDGHWSWIYAFNDQVTTRIDTAKVASVADLTPENCTVTDVNLWQWMSQQSLPQAAE